MKIIIIFIALFSISFRASSESIDIKYPKKYKFSDYLITALNIQRNQPLSIKFRLSLADGNEVAGFRGNLIVNCETLQIYNLSNEYISYSNESLLGSYMQEMCSDSGKSKNSASKSKIKKEATRTYEVEANEYFLQQQALYDQQMELYRIQQAEYTKQKNEYDSRVAAEEEKRRKEKGMRQLEMGLRMLAGESLGDAAMGAARIPPLRISPPSMPRMQLQENYSITTPNGSLVNCRYDPNIRQAICY
jgi:hypothetical protein